MNKCMNCGKMMKKDNVKVCLTRGFLIPMSMFEYRHECKGYIERSCMICTRYLDHSCEKVTGKRFNEFYAHFCDQYHFRVGAVLLNGN